ncbi:MAG: (Fe-S)-binding protein [Spirochaetota bacterium]|nr:(Fe-S)-binding protein [Spirochaetota bacterium]
MNIPEFYDIPPTDISREFFFNIGGTNGFMRWGIYLYLIVAIIYLSFTLIKRVRIWRKGNDELRTDFPEKRIVAIFKYVFLQVKTFREAYAGTMHGCIFFGFLGLFIVMSLIGLQHYFTDLLFNTKFIYGNIYLIWSLIGDFFGLIIITGIVMAFRRRYILKPNRLDTKPIDTFTLILILLIVITGFFSEAMRIAISGFPEFEVWSPCGYILSLAFSFSDTPTIEVAHYINWWIHTISAFGFIGLLASGKLGHILISSLNVYYQNLNTENPDTKYTFHIIHPAKVEDDDTIGVSRVEEFTWKQLMDCDACMRCGRCQDRCPAYITEKPLSPKNMINDIKNNMDIRIPKLITAEDPTKVESQALIGGSVLEDVIWSCTNCAACQEVCPVQIEHMNKITDMRRHLVLKERKISRELQTAFNNIEENSNPFGISFASRGDWITEELGIKALSKDPDVDFLYFVGCSASYDKRNQKVASALVKTLKMAGYKIGILGSEEACCGDSAMRTGNEYLFHTLAAQNLETFNNYGVKKIITTCPHGYNILKKEYPEFAKVGVDSYNNPLECNYEVYHHTEIIADLLRKGQIKITNALIGKITYHDSCFLGRYNKIYNYPRDIIRAIPGTEFIEMNWHHKTSFCCGAGGGLMWLDENLGSRINQFRTKDAHDTGATKIGTACPFCLTKITDGITELDIQNMETCDIVELVYNLMEK